MAYENLNAAQLRIAASLGNPDAISICKLSGFSIETPVDWDSHAARQAAIEAVADTRAKRDTREWKSIVVGYAVDVAEHVLPNFEKEHPSDARPREALNLARRWADGDESVTEEMLRDAASASWSASAASASYAAAYASSSSSSAEEKAWQRGRLAEIVMKGIVEKSNARKPLPGATEVRPGTFVVDESASVHTFKPAYRRFCWHTWVADLEFKAEGRSPWGPDWESLFFLGGLGSGAALLPTSLIYINPHSHIIWPILVNLGVLAGFIFLLCRSQGSRARVSTDKICIRCGRVRLDAQKAKAKLEAKKATEEARAKEAATAEAKAKLLKDAAIVALSRYRELAKKA